MTTDEILEKIVEAKIFDNVQDIAKIERALKLQEAYEQILDESLGLKNIKTGEECGNKFNLKYQVAQRFGGLYKGE